MLVNGNAKLGLKREVWSWSLPAMVTCPGRTEVCERECYSLKTERLRPTALAAHRRNLDKARSPHFVTKILQWIAYQDIVRVRVHADGDFFDPEYTEKWLKIFRRAKDTRFWYYTRSWRDPEIRRVLNKHARLANVRAWWSVDRETGLPEKVPQRVRLAWLMDQHEVEPPLDPRIGVVFRTRKLRRQACKQTAGVLVCPAENGVKTKTKITCTSCTWCADNRFLKPLLVCS